MNEELKKKIFQKVDESKDEMVQVLSELIQLKSVTPTFGWNPEEAANQESEVNRRMKKVMDSIGVETELYAKAENRENLCGRFRGTGGGKSLMFTGHVDVVPPGDLSGWTEAEPFSGKVDDEFIYGRGSVDMKSGNTAAVFALKALKDAGIRLKGDVVFNHVVGEEMKENYYGTTACIEHGYRADAAILCEPSCSDEQPFQVNVCSGGVAQFKVVVKGKGCHCAARGQVIRDGGYGSLVGVDAIEKGMVVYNALKELEKQWGQTKRHERFPIGHFCINPGVIQGGIAGSTVAPGMSIEYVALFPPQDTFEGVMDEIEECISNACLNDPWLKENPPEVIRVFDWPAFETSVEEPVALMIQKAAREVVPEGGDMTALRPVCDAPYLNEKGIPTVLLGPGNVNYPHTEGEKLEIQSLVDAAKIYALAMVEWCGIEE